MDNRHRYKDSLIIRSSVDYLKDVERFVESVFKQRGISDVKFNRLFLCVSEGVSNAIIHGNKNQLDKYVKIRIELNHIEAVITIEDEGSGFNYGEVPEPVGNDNILKEQGRGLHIIKTYAKNVSFLNRGSTLKIIFDISADDTIFS